MADNNQRKTWRLLGIIGVVAVAVLALALLAFDSADDHQLEEGVLAVPVESLEDQEPVETPDNDTSVAKPSGPYAPQ